MNTNNKQCLEIKKLYKASIFNHSLGNSLSNSVNLQELIFGYEFNHKLHNSLYNLHNLQILTFGYSFNKSLGDSLSNLHNLRKLTFGFCFNQPLNDSLSNLSNLTKLTFGFCFNKPIDIPMGIKKLSLNCNSQAIIDYIPFSIEELVLGSYFNLELNDLPSSIKKLKSKIRIIIKS